MSDDESGDEDWFERGLRDEEAAAGSVDDEDDDSDAAASASDEGATSAPEDGSTATDDQPAFGADAESDAGFGQFGETDGTDAGPGDGETEPGGPGDDAGFGDLGGGDDGGFGGGGGDMFDEDFASAFEGGSGGNEEFDDEEFESDIPRIDLGITGLDQMIQGGVPQRHLMVVIGSAGTGKTTFGLQFLYHGLQQGERCVFITLEQTHDAIVDTANEWGWDFDAYEESDDLAIIDLDPVEMANSLDNIRGELPELIEEFGADRLVLDSVSLLEMMYDDQARRRTEVFDFTKSLKEAGVTTFLTSEASETNAYASRHGIIEYLTDAVFVLQYVRSEMRETRLAVEIQKIRNANHSRETKPYEITNDGISVYQQANIF